MHIRIALLGFGNVNREFARLFLRKTDALKGEHDLTFTVTGIASHSHGWAINPDGLDLNAALDAYANSSLDNLNQGGPLPDSMTFTQNVPADIVVEATWMDPKTGQPATDLIRTALERGISVVTANKGPLAFAYRELRDLAASKGVGFFFESTVMGGGPVHTLAREALPVSTIHHLRGILNSTTNSILTHLERGVPFEDAVVEMQEAGIAEADPTNDLEGWDAAVKIVTLANVHMGADLRPNDVERTGIMRVTAIDAQTAATEGKRLKLLCEAWREGDKIKARVKPTAIPLDDPLAHVSGTSAAVTFNTDTLVGVTVIEGPSGPDTTAYGMLADVVNIVRGRHKDI